MKKGIIIIVIAVIAAIAATAAALYFLGGEPLSKTVSLNGYEISVPKDWVASADGTLTDKEGSVAGRYMLINEELSLDNNFVYAEETSIVPTEQTDFAANIKKSTFETAKGKTVQYLIYNLPNPEPYAATVTLYLDRVSPKTADGIAKSFKMPVIGSKPPAKNIPVPLFDEIETDKAAKLTAADGTVSVKNISLIDGFIKMQSEGNATGLDIITYKKDENENLLLESWSHVENSNGQGFMYIYKDRGDGVYTYDNNPVIFQSITKEVQKDKGITAYRLKIGEAETTNLLEIPIDLYRDNAQELVAMKTDASTEESVSQILDQIIPAEERAGVTSEKKNDSVTIIFGEGSKTDAKNISKDAAVIFALSPDVNTVTAKDANGKTYVLERDEILSEVKDAADAATKSPEDFAKFTEELEKVEPPKAEGATGGNVPSGTVLYSGTVVISANTMVTHPRTGERVAVGPYAEARGYGGYLGKPITVTFTQKGKGCIATATCGGAVIASQAFESVAAAQSAINMVKAYS